MLPIYLHYLNALDVEALALTDDEILTAVEAGLAAQGRRETVIEPRMHLIPDPAVPGHFNVLRGSFREPINLAGVKVISDYVDNYKEGLPSEVGLLLLMDSRNGVPKAIIDGSHLTDMRTGAVTAIGAKYLARKNSRVLGHVGARGTAYWNVRLLDRLFNFEEIRVHSRRPESRNAFAARLSKELGKPVKATSDWCYRRRRYHRGSLAPAGACSHAEDGVDQEGCLRRSLRYDERCRTLANRHNVQSDC
jgi:alanine dehydrogenase